MSTEQSKTNVPLPNTPSKPLRWTRDHEKILVDWADKAMCYRWLHSKSHEKYSKLNTYFTIPVIIMSTITGTANFAADRVPLEYRGIYSMTIGGVNIIAGIVTTVQQFLKISEINEAHRVSSISWDKFYRKIRVELAKSPSERQNVYDFLKTCTEEFDRLMEISPSIKKDIILMFNKTFNGDGVDSKRREMFEALKKPEICDYMESLQFSIYKEDSASSEIGASKPKLVTAVQTLLQTRRQNKDKHFKDIDQFVHDFKKEMMRNPNKQELLNNLDMEKLGVDDGIVNDYVNEHPELFSIRSLRRSDSVLDFANTENDGSFSEGGKEDSQHTLLDERTNADKGGRVLDIEQGA